MGEGKKRNKISFSKAWYHLHAVTFLVPAQLLVFRHFSVWVPEDLFQNNAFYHHFLPVDSAQRRWFWLLKDTLPWKMQIFLKLFECTQTTSYRFQFLRGIFVGTQEQDKVLQGLYTISTAQSTRVQPYLSYVPHLSCKAPRCSQAARNLSWIFSALVRLNSFIFLNFSFLFESVKRCLLTTNKFM